jgi:hypothetical protein
VTPQYWISVPIMRANPEKKGGGIRRELPLNLKLFFRDCILERPAALLSGLSLSLDLF